MPCLIAGVELIHAGVTDIQTLRITFMLALLRMAWAIYEAYKAK